MASAEVYAGGALTYTEIPELCDDYITCAESEVAGGILLGYQVTDWLAIETSARYFGSNFEGNNHDGIQTQYDLYGYDAALLSRVPFFESDSIAVRPLLRLGALYTNEGGVDPILGLGLELEVGDKGVRLLYEYADGVVDKGEINVFSLGLVWRLP
jgi:hypothetical protein